ncbi:hypothetical protein EW145_g703 [Phellinidium pouzarii]|uniref:Splicing factor YJU2 n=1 Tax=Phellinidium pouzarii TaxID=167371 RepID=A0A4S4LMW1_9AGAM|nr:hypothetical protein EW145_g703 [Phellinidium pouzarii]
MAERKVLNKYIPPDFDPSLIPRRKQPKNKQQVVRLMAPFSMRCNTCGEYIYKGKKFNARKETVEGEDYYGIKIFRFYIKCTLCSAEITFKTDPKNTDYLAEHGASRNFEPWREEREADEEDKLARLEAEENNPMQVLENRTLDSKREMDILDALQDIRARNARNERVAGSGGAELLDRIARDEVEEDEERTKKLEDDEDERLVREIFSKVNAAGPSKLPALRDSPVDGESSPFTTTITVKRKADGDEPELHRLLSDNAKSLLATKNAESVLKKRKMDSTNALGIKIMKKGKAPTKVAS